MKSIRHHSGLFVAALTIAALTITAAEPAQAQGSSASNFAAYFKKDRNTDTAQQLEQNGNRMRERRTNVGRSTDPDFNGPAYRQHAGNLAANADLQQLEQRGYDARRARPGQQVNNENDLTPNERQQLDRRGRNAQVARGARPGYQNTGHPALQNTRKAPQRVQARTPRGENFRGRSYREHVGRLAGNSDLQQLEQRDYEARRARPGHKIRDEYDLTPNERRDLQQRGRQAQVVRGQRNGFRPVTHSNGQFQARTTSRSNFYPGAGRQPARGQGARNTRVTKRITNTARTGYTATSLSNKVAAVDMGTEAFGGRSTGIGEFGADMTFGQAQTFANGDDPVIAAGLATQRFGRNLEGAARGVGDSIRDPRRIPGNMGRAVTGVARTGVGAVQYVGHKAIKKTRDGARFMTDPKYAGKQINYGARQVNKTVRNVGKSTCKGFSTLLGLNKKKCK